MGATHSKKRQKHGEAGSFNAAADGYGDGISRHSTSRMAAKLRWSKVKCLINKYKRSSKAIRANSKKKSSRIPEKEILPEIIKNTCEEILPTETIKNTCEEILPTETIKNTCEEILPSESIKNTCEEILVETIKNTCEEILPETIKNTCEVLRLIEDRNVDENKYLDRSFSFNIPKVKDEEQLAKPKSTAPAEGEDKVVLYFTSLRVIRKTFDECCAVKLILASLQVLVDERDISLHAPFRQELQDLLAGMPLKVPSLFIAGKYIGGIEEIQQLHESAELSKHLEGFPLHTSSSPGPCHGCGDARFVPCLNCDGSRKVFIEDMGDQPLGEGEFIRCPECNENGLIRCPLCCS